MCVYMHVGVCLCSLSVYRLGIRQARTGSVTLPSQSLYLWILIELQASLTLSLSLFFSISLYHPLTSFHKNQPLFADTSSRAQKTSEIDAPLIIVIDCAIQGLWHFV